MASLATQGGVLDTSSVPPFSSLPSPCAHSIQSPLTEPCDSGSSKSPDSTCSPKAHCLLQVRLYQPWSTCSLLPALPAFSPSWLQSTLQKAPEDSFTFQPCSETMYYSPGLIRLTQTYHAFLILSSCFKIQERSVLRRRSQSPGSGSTERPCN